MKPVTATPNPEIIAVELAFVAMPLLHAQITLAMLGPLRGDSGHAGQGEQEQRAYRKVRFSHDHSPAARRTSAGPI